MGIVGGKVANLARGNPHPIGLVPDYFGDFVAQSVVLGSDTAKDCLAFVTLAFCRLCLPILLGKKERVFYVLCLGHCHFHNDSSVGFLNVHLVALSVCVGSSYLVITTITTVTQKSKLFLCDTCHTHL